MPSFFSRTWLSLSVGCLLLALLLAACGSGDTGTGTTSASPSVSTPTQQGNQGAPTTTAPISCSRVSEATISQAISLKVAPPHEMQISNRFANSTTCIYQDAATSQIQELVITYLNGPAASQSYDDSTQNTTSQQSISGLGDKAVFDTHTSQLHVLKGDLYFIVSLDKLGEQGQSSSKLLADARHIATAILAHA